MIDAFYQSLVCFFIPYFVSLFFVSIIWSSFTRCTDLLIISPLSAPLSLFFSPGLCWLWCGSVYMGNSYHQPCFIYHSAALGHWDQNLGKESNFRSTDGNTPSIYFFCLLHNYLQWHTELSDLAIVWVRYVWMCEPKRRTQLQVIQWRFIGESLVLAGRG